MSEMKPIKCACADLPCNDGGPCTPVYLCTDTDNRIGELEREVERLTMERNVTARSFTAKCRDVATLTTEVERLTRERDEWSAVASQRNLDKTLALEERDEARRDAKRYQWLRAGDGYSRTGLYVADGGKDWRAVGGEELDQRIDTQLALAAEKGE